MNVGLFFAVFIDKDCISQALLTGHWRLNITPFLEYYYLWNSVVFTSLRNQETESWLFSVLTVIPPKSGLLTITHLYWTLKLDWNKEVCGSWVLGVRSSLQTR